MITFPRLNMNGTSRDELISQCLSCVNALNEAINIMWKATPHGRDYQISDHADYGEAVKEHAKRVAEVCSVRDEMQMIADQIASQGGGR